MDSWIYYFIGMIVIVLVFVYIVSAIIKSGDEPHNNQHEGKLTTESLPTHNISPAKKVLQNLKNENFIEKFYPNEAKTLYTFIPTDYPAESKCQLLCHTIFHHINDGSIEERLEDRNNKILTGFVFWSMAAKTLNKNINEDYIHSATI